MAWRGPQREPAGEQAKPKGFDDFELRLGDVMRGERATMGKSLLDVQRELRIKASYIAAIENCDFSVFETPGFVAGYVRSYARYLKMDPDRTYEKFCAESGFSTAHGLSPEASSRRNAVAVSSVPTRRTGHDPFEAPRTPFVPQEGSLFSGFAPQALGSSLVLLAVIGLISYGGWALLREIQRVNVTPVDQAPEVALTEFDDSGMFGNDTADDVAGLYAPTADQLDRLYRPQALDVPVVVPRDGAIATVDPSTVGAFSTVRNRPVAPQINAPDEAFVVATVEEAVETVIAEEEPVATVAETQQTVLPKVIAAAAPQVALLAVQPVWVRVRGGDGTVIFEKILDPGEEYLLPAMEVPPVLRSGNSGALYFRIDDRVFGPAGDPGAVAKNVALSAQSLTESYAQADPSADADLAKFWSVASAE